MARQPTPLNGCHQAPGGRLAILPDRATRPASLCRSSRRATARFCAPLRGRDRLVHQESVATDDLTTAACALVVLERYLAGYLVELDR